MSMLPVGIGSAAAAGGYQIERSLRFNSADSAYLNRTPASAGSRRTFTVSAWVKRSALTTWSVVMAAGVNADNVQTDFLGFDFSAGNSLSTGFNDGTYFLTSAAVFRDFSAWYHLVYTIDTTQATSTNRVKVYVNGVQQTMSGTYPPQNFDCAFNTTNLHAIGARSRGGSVSNYTNWYMTEINFIDGQALDPTSFGETDTDTGVWKPKAYSGSYGTNGFYLKFADNSGTTSTTLGKDSSGNGNNWTPNNFSVTAGAGNDSLVDTPTNYGTDTGVGGEVRGNYATFNPLDKGSSVTLANGNLDATLPEQPVSSTIAVSSGKYYSEVLLTTQGSVLIGWVNASYYPSQGQPWDSGDNALYYAANGQKVINNSFTSYASSATNGDVIGVAVDLDSDTIEFFKNGSSLGSFSKTFTGNYKFVVADATTATNTVLSANFGQRPFAYTAPSGFKALCTQNLPEPTIKDGGDYFNTVLYTGNGGTAQNITGAGFQPDFVWLKSRNSGSFSHRLYDAVRGAGKEMYSNATAAESDVPQSLTAFISDGFSLGTDTNNNATSTTYVAWNWKANGAGSSNTAGTITSTVSVNTTSGFSIVTYTGNLTSGATVGHGLGVVPAMVIQKNRITTDEPWFVYHTSLGATKFLRLNATDAEATNSSIWNNTAPTSTVVTLGNNPGVNGSSQGCVLYCFAPVAGYSAFGSYTGNGSADGPMVFTGFRPAFVVVKCSSSSQSGNAWWVMYDNKRIGYNSDNRHLGAQSSDAEYTANSIDLLSNGFKLRDTNSSRNASGSTYIYMAFAESPFRYSLAR